MPQLQPDTQLSAYTSKIRRPSPSSHLRVQWQSKSQKEMPLLSFFLLKSRFKLWPFITKSRLESLITIL